MRPLPSRNARPRIPPTSTSGASRLPRRCSCRNNSSSSGSSSQSSKQRVLSKPDKFRPPSHPARRVVQHTPRNYPGPPPTAQEIEERKTKRYPHMFPPEGTVMYKFLTNRGIHVWISLSVLFSLAAFTFTTNFKMTSPFAHLLPSWSEFFAHPISSTSQFFTVMKMHSDHQTLQASEKRKRLSDDVVKRREYRIAHGLEEPENNESGQKDADADADDNSPVAPAAAGAAADGKNTGDYYVDFEGNKRPVKKWLGIW
ncbi:hypothetical protein VTO42DRAFT_6678 [Malbranchea cinnamomea]